LSQPLACSGGQWAIRTPGLWLRRLAANLLSCCVCLLYRLVKVCPASSSTHRSPSNSGLLLARALASHLMLFQAFLPWNAYGDAPRASAARVNSPSLVRQDLRPRLEARTAADARQRAGSSHLPPLSSPHEQARMVLAGRAGLRVLPGPPKSPRTLGAGCRGILRKKSGGKTEKTAGAACAVAARHEVMLHV